MATGSKQQLTISVHQEDDSFWATVQEFPGVFASGDTLDELRRSLEEGIAFVLAPEGEEPPKVEIGSLRLEQPMVASAPLAYA